MPSKHYPFVGHIKLLSDFFVCLFQEVNRSRVRYIEESDITAETPGSVRIWVWTIWNGQAVCMAAESRIDARIRGAPRFSSAQTQRGDSHTVIISMFRLVVFYSRELIFAELPDLSKHLMVIWSSGGDVIWCTGSGSAGRKAHSVF